MAKAILNIATPKNRLVADTGIPINNPTPSETPPM
jgi:hypothetical protein